MKVGARIGIAAYGLTHLLVAWLALQIAFGSDGGERAVLVVIAAILYRPEEAGLDAALRTLAGQPLGPYLLVAIALGVLAYGVFCFFDARYHRV